MDRRKLESMFQVEKQDFTGEEITTYKRYIEENNVHTDNNFEFLESNLSYYSTRYTSEYYFSPSELLQANSNFIASDEMNKNVQLYLRSVEWFSKTVHPEDSEYVIKQEKYTFIHELGGIRKDLFDYLNLFPMSDYQCMDLMFYDKGTIYQYLPAKNFVFAWRKNCESVGKQLRKNQFYQLKNTTEEPCSEDALIILPIFIPIRQMMFVGEFGYRSALIKYGQVIERIHSFLSRRGRSQLVERLEHHQLHDLIGLDGIEKSILNILVYEEGAGNDGRLAD